MWRFHCVPSQLFARFGAKQCLEGLDSSLFSDIPNGIQTGNVVEFYGKEGCGKTEMLIHLMANCILPKSWKDLPLDGKGVCVIMVDTDYHFQLLRLITVLEQRILNSIKQSGNISESFQCNSTASSESEVPERYRGFEEFVKSCLSRLFVVRCSSSIQLLATLLSLENLIAAKPEVGVLMIDSLGAFYWLDRCCGGESQSDQEANLKKTVIILKKYIKEYHLVLITTTHAIFGSADKSAHRGYLCSAWQQLVDYRYLFDRVEPVLGARPVYSAQRLCRPCKKLHRFHIQESGVTFI